MKRGRKDGVTGSARAENGARPIRTGPGLVGLLGAIGAIGAFEFTCDEKEIGFRGVELIILSCCVWGTISYPIAPDSFFHPKIMGLNQKDTPMSTV